MTIVSPYVTFPPISWWAMVLNADLVIFDGAEHFQKMTHRNRYDISGANNTIKLSVPLVNGRNQRVPMREVCIHNEERWQVQHWRTLVSVYKRTPFFDHYATTLGELFQTQFTHLADFNKATHRWVKAQLRQNYKEEDATAFIRDYPADTADLRFGTPPGMSFPHYYQVFEERIGFLPNLSILDLLFSEGPGTVSYLRGVIK